MVARLAGAPLLAVVGPSGSGKSSAMRAGLLAALSRGALPGSQRLEHRCCSARASTPCGTLERSRAGSRRPGRLLVAVDQFEETFTLCRDKDERAAFVDALVEMAADTVRHAAVLLAIRADFYGDCAAHPDLVRLRGGQPCPGRHDAARRAAAGDRASRAPRAPPRRAGQRRAPARRRRRPAGRAAAAVHGTGRAVATARGTPDGIGRLRMHRRAAGPGGATGGDGVRPPRCAPPSHRAPHPAAAGRRGCRRCPRPPARGARGVRRRPRRRRAPRARRPCREAA